VWFKLVAVVEHAWFVFPGSSDAIGSYRGEEHKAGTTHEERPPVVRDHKNALWPGIHISDIQSGHEEGTTPRLTIDVRLEAAHDVSLGVLVLVFSTRPIWSSPPPLKWSTTMRGRGGRTAIAMRHDTRETEGVERGGGIPDENEPEPRLG
jgi:hypothetical protein